MYLPADASPQKAEKSGPGFYQLALGVSFNLNSRRGETDVSGDDEDFFIPDGLSLHAGYGLHLKKWIGISANTGIDWRVNPKLVNVPVYALLTLNPHFNKGTSFLAQAGIGHAFALGRGNLNGTYQKYRIGIHFNDNWLIFADASLFGYELKDIRQTGAFTVGLSILAF